MRTLKKAREILNGVFDLLDLIVVRLFLLGLAALGAYSLLTQGHP